MFLATCAHERPRSLSYDSHSTQLCAEHHRLWTLSTLLELEELVIFPFPLGPRVLALSGLPDSLPGYSGLHGNLSSLSPRPFWQPVLRGPHQSQRVRLCNFAHGLCTAPPGEAIVPVILWDLQGTQVE